MFHQQAERLGITPQKVGKEQSTINYRVRRDLCRKRKSQAWKEAMSGELHERETSEPTGNASSSGGATMKKARTGIHTFQVGDRVMSKAKDYDKGAKGYPEGFWPAKVVEILVGDRFKIEWDQVVEIISGNFRPPYACTLNRVRTHALLRAHSRKHTQTHDTCTRTSARAHTHTHTHPKKKNRCFYKNLKSNEILMKYERCMHTHARACIFIPMH